MRVVASNECLPLIYIYIYIYIHTQVSPLYMLVGLVFILLASLTVMNMLIGILCEVVSVVSSVEKEQLVLSFVKEWGSL